MNICVPLTIPSPPRGERGPTEMKKEFPPPRETVSSSVMPAEAGIQAVGAKNNFKYLDSGSLLKTCRDKLRGNDDIFPIAAQPQTGEG